MPARQCAPGETAAGRLSRTRAFPIASPCAPAGARPVGGHGPTSGETRRAALHLTATPPRRRGAEAKAALPWDAMSPRIRPCLQVACAWTSSVTHTQRERGFFKAAWLEFPVLTTTGIVTAATVQPARPGSLSSIPEDTGQGESDRGASSPPALTRLPPPALQLLSLRLRPIFLEPSLLQN